MEPIKTYRAETTMRFATTLEVLRLTDNLHAFRLTNTPTVLDRHGDLPDGAVIGSAGALSEREGFVDDDNLRALCANQPWQALDLMLLDAASIEALRIKGYVRVADELPSRAIRQPVFTELSSGQATLDNVVRWEFASHSVFDHAGRPLPLALHCDYLNGGYDESQYDLVRAIDHLRQRKDVTLFRDPPWSASYAERKGLEPVAASTAKEARCRIPSYNARTGRSLGLHFVWSPNAEDWARLAAHADASLGYGGRYRALFELDLLGLREAKAALFERYGQSAALPDEDGDDQ